MLSQEQEHQGDVRRAEMVESACQHDRIWDLLRGDPSKEKGEDGFISPTAITRRLRFSPDWWQKGFSKTLQAWGSHAHYRQVPELYQFRYWFRRWSETIPSRSWCKQVARRPALDSDRQRELELLNLL